MAARPKFLVSVRVLSRRFRTLFHEALLAAFRGGKLEFHGKLKHLEDPAAFLSWLESTRAKDWVVYAKKTFGGPAHALQYLGRYTHKVAISNHRLERVTNDNVTFRWKDYRSGQTQLLMSLHPHEFMRRFLLHILPLGFVRIRYGGFLAHRHRAAKIALCRTLLQQPPTIPSSRTVTPPSTRMLATLCRDSLSPPPISTSSPPDTATTIDWKQRYKLLTGRSVDDCSACGHGYMAIVTVIPAVASLHRKTRKQRRHRRFTVMSRALS